MSKPVNLGDARAAKFGDCRKWTVVEALRQAVDDVESGRINPKLVYIAFQNPQADGTFYPYIAAGGTNLELQGLLAQHSFYRARG